MKTQKPALRKVRLESLQSASQSTLTLLSQAYAADPFWEGMFVLAFAQQAAVERLSVTYQAVSSPSEILELLGEGATQYPTNPACFVRDELRVRWRGLTREFTRQEIVAYLGAEFVDLPGWLDARAQLGRLSDEQLRLVSLLYLEGLTQVEVAALLGVTERTIRNRLTEIEELLGDD